MSTSKDDSTRVTSLMEELQKLKKKASNRELRIQNEDWKMF